MIIIRIEDVRGLERSNSKNVSIERSNSKNVNVMLTLKTPAGTVINCSTLPSCKR